jgi:hypothetical protein
MHYSIETWADFARGIILDRQAAEMQAHLSGCAPCARTVSLFNRISTIANRHEPAVPRYLVRQAITLFAVAGPRAESVGAKLAKLVFDSFLQPLPAGVRSTAQLCQQALFEAENILVDVRVEREGEHVMLTGQVSDRHPVRTSRSRLTAPKGAARFAPTRTASSRRCSTPRSTARSGSPAPRVRRSSFQFFSLQVVVRAVLRPRCRSFNCAMRRGFS